MDEILAHARDEAPNECCGLLLGQDERVVAAWRARNLEASPTRFLIDPADHIAARRAGRARGLDVVGFYHSHPRSPAVPSARDVAEASYPDAIHVIAGWRGHEPEVRAFRVANGIVEERPLSVERSGSLRVALRA